MKLSATKILLAIAASLMLAAADVQAATERYNVDLDHSIVGFSVAHMVVSKTTGRFTDYAGFIEMDPEAKTMTALEAVIKTASVNTNHEKREKANRPLQRIMAIEAMRDGTTEVTTTDSHLARGIAEALHDAFKGDLKLRYSRDENLLRAIWRR